MKCILLLAFFVPMLANAKVKIPDEQFAFGFAVEQPVFFFNLTPTNKDIDSEVRYRPNLANTSGITFSLFGIGIRYLTQQEFTEKSQNDLGNTSYDDIRLGTSFGDKLQFRIEGHYARYKGLYIENSAEVDSSFTGSATRIQRDDMEIITWGTELYWTLHPDRFSQAAAFTYSAVQEESGGSWMFKIDFDRANFSADSAIIPTQVSTDFGEDAGLIDGNFTTLSGLAGYGYTFVWRGFFFTPMGLAGYGLQSRTFNLGSREKDGISTVQKFNIGVGTGYNAGRFYAGFKLDLNSLVYKTGSIRIDQSLQAFTLSTGYRF